MAAVLSAATALLWLSTLIESKQLGPREPVADPAEATPAVRPGPSDAEQFGTAA